MCVEEPRGNDCSTSGRCFFFARLAGSARLPVINPGFSGNGDGKGRTNEEYKGKDKTEDIRKRQIRYGRASESREEKKVNEYTGGESVDPGHDGCTRTDDVRVERYLDGISRKLEILPAVHSLVYIACDDHPPFSEAYQRSG